MCFKNLIAIWFEGDLVQSRDFHYTVEPVYRRPRDLAGTGTGSGYGHRGEPDYSYIEHKASPYHSGNPMEISFF